MWWINAESSAPYIDTNKNSIDPREDPGYNRSSTSPSVS
jgi:hypothetical protein